MHVTEPCFIKPQFLFSTVYLCVFEFLEIAVISKDKTKVLISAQGTGKGFADNKKMHLSQSCEQLNFFFLFYVSFPCL